MEIERYAIPRARLEEFADKNELIMVVRERNIDELPHLTVNDTFYAHFKNAEIKDGSMLCGTFGNGISEKEAIANYIPEISGKLLVINAGTEERREIEVPILIG